MRSTVCSKHAAAIGWPSCSSRTVLDHYLVEARAVRGGRLRDPVRLLGEPAAGSA
jgi:hypothetical protein